MSEKNPPLWLSISRQIEHDIEEGTYKDAAMLPTEIELCDIYSASRITIRGAMARLVDLGKVKRIKGKGTIINRKKVEEIIYKIVGFTQEMQSKGIIPSTGYVNVETRTASGYVSELFGLPSSAEFTVLERVRCVNDVPLGHFITYIPASVGLPEEAEKYYGSLYDMLKKEFQLKIDYIKQTVSAEIPDKVTKERLNLLTGEPVLLMKRWAYNKGKLVEYTICKYDSKRYEYKFELKEDDIYKY